ncbi:hypothetical protein ASE01_01340 [Nocardioides sp. Root190]|nr:hypothetical protein ASE01_01340 [Nocardioides sp. Root190]
MEKLLFLLLPLPFGIGLAASGPSTEPVESEVVFHFTDPDILESSGLVARDGLVVTVNDSGDGNRIFTVDPATGDTVGVTSWQGEARDIEALAPAGDGHVYVGDIGDNTASRDSIEVARVPFGRGEREVRATTYELVYPDGAHDAESLLVDPATGRLYVVAKEFIGRLYLAPATLDPDGPNQLEAVDEVLGIATDGAFLPDGKHLVLRNYTQAAVYAWPELDRVAILDLPAQQQGEGIAVSEDGEVLVSSEGKDADVLRVDLPISEEPQGDPTDGSSTPASPGTAGESAPVEVVAERSWWPWALGGVVGAVVIGVLVRSLRPR